MNTDNIPMWGWMLILILCVSSWHSDNKIKSLESKVTSLQSEVDDQSAQISNLKDTIENLGGNSE